jgi:Domain of unknown function (DUF1707)
VHVALLHRADLRASDLDRERAVEFLKAHFADGRLAEHELAWRADAAYRAVHLGDLDRLTVDLPAFVTAPRRRRRVRPAALVLLALLVVLAATVPPEAWLVAFVILVPLAVLLVAFVAPIAIPLLVLALLVRMVVGAGRPAPPRVGWR